MPSVKIAGLTTKGAIGPWSSTEASEQPLDTPSTVPVPAGEWQSTFDPTKYNPVSKSTITLSVVPKREGTFFFRHVNYVVEGTLPGKGRFKVVRRYSDFVWLLECLQKKYPFRLLPILPPKRLAGNVVKLLR